MAENQINNEVREVKSVYYELSASEKAMFKALIDLAIAFFIQRNEVDNHERTDT